MVRIRIYFNIPDSWNDKVNVLNLEYEIATDSIFSNVIENGIVDWSDKDLGLILDVNEIGPLYGRYRVVTDLGKSEWSDVVTCDLNIV